ncbi:hypothetical protein [Clostridium frigidicarnis]|uniref:Uncharacterized protein n=1 Tax=Clostridium frigidicarnis TaxID=84698 RepID=A0A1I0V2Z1_9CLOT|nr:hypothetical protein [Clostridium frigidicarnis]SFA70651.1 hypothetical protein SAMN04488528_1001122 [Clostridium frigidicarnis]
MKKFKVKVVQEKEYEIEIDESIINEEFIKGFERYMHNLDECYDKYASIAYDIAWNKANDSDYEGYGCPLIKGESLFRDGQEQQGINFTKIDEEYEDIEVEEIFKIKARETITDQFDNKRIICNKEYDLVSEYDDKYSIVDETGKTVNFSKNYFYTVEE